MTSPRPASANTAHDDDGASQHWLFAYFTPETEEDGEQVRFAVNAGPNAKRWTALNDGAPILTSDVGARR